MAAFALGLCLPVSAAEIRSADGNSLLRAAEIAGLGESKMVLKGDAYVKLADKASGTVFEANAAVITIVQFTKAKASEQTQGKKANSVGGINMGLAAIKSVEFVGPVKITYCKPKEIINASGQKATVMTQMDANSNSARYDGVKQMAYLTGNVTMTMTDPTMYETPAVATGEVVEVNMKPNPGPDDLVFRISTPGGVSHLEATPLPKEETKNK